VSCRGPFGELAGVVGIFHFHQAGQVANVFDSARERIIEFPAGGDVIADCITPFRDSVAATSGSGRLTSTTFKELRSSGQN